jgi:hypothetical protein
MNASTLTFHYQPLSEDQSFHFSLSPSLTTSGDVIFPFDTGKP